MAKTYSASDEEFVEIIAQKTKRKAIIEDAEKSRSASGRCELRDKCEFE